MPLDAEGIKLIQETAVKASGGTLHEIDGITFSSVPLSNVRKPDPMPAPLVFHTLDALLNYAKEGPESVVIEEKGFFFQVDNPTAVSLCGPLVGHYKQREVLAIARYEPPGFNFGTYMDQSSFSVFLQTCFVRDENLEEVLKVVGTIVSEAKVSMQDDGVTQEVTAKAGVALVQRTSLPNPIVLRPFRTFPECDQPTEIFVLRISDKGQLALFGADGGNWKLVASKEIGNYLTRRQKDEDFPIAVFV